MQFTADKNIIKGLKKTDHHITELVPNLKLPQLTFTRFIAAVAIVIYHFKNTTFPFNIEYVNNFVKYFNVFVSYFFVLSGFILVISGSYRLSFRRFYVNRFARIYPLYLFALLLMLFIFFIARTPKDIITSNEFFLSFLLIQAWFQKYALSLNFPAWSLSVEAFFYLIFPVVIYLFRNISLKRELIIFGAVWLMFQIYFMWIYSSGNSIGMYHPFFHLSTFLIGIIAGKFFIAKQGFLWLNLNKIIFIFSISGVILTLLILTRNDFFKHFYANGLLAPFFVLVIYITALSRNKFFLFFKKKRLQYLGEISYGIYILQIPISIFVFGIIDKTFKFSVSIYFYIYLIILFVVSALTHELIEKPCSKFIKNINRN